MMQFFVTNPNKTTLEQDYTLPNVRSCRGHRIGDLYFMAALPPGCILKSLAGLSCLPHHAVGLLEVQTGAGMDEEADRKVSQGREDALAHSTLLPGHHSLVL